MENNIEYSKEDLKEIFEIVNSKYLHLKGRKKTISKNQFVSVWKQDNKNLSAFELMIALYNAESINDKHNEFIKEFIEDTLSIDEVKSKKPISYFKHIKRMRWKDQEIEELEYRIETMMDDNSLISIEDHKIEIKELKNKYKNELDEKDDEIKKLEMKIKLINTDNNSKIERIESQLEYYKNQIEILTNG